jgi:hypothetical protein
LKIEEALKETEFREKHRQRCTEKMEVEEGSDSAPSPPKRSSLTNKRLKRWSKLIKDSLPTKSVKSSNHTEQQQQPKKNCATTESQRKSLKDKLTEGELAVFLRERRAVSESRFKVLDRLNSQQQHVGGGRELIRTTSDPKIHQICITSGTLSNLKRKFEIEGSQELESPTLLKEALRASKSSLKGSRSSLKSSREQVSKVREHKQSRERDEPDNSTTSPESGIDDSKKSDSERKRSKSDKPSGMSKEKKKKKKKEKSGGNSSDKEGKKKKSKKEKEKSVKSSSGKKKQVTILNGDSAHVQTVYINGGPKRPDLPKEVDLDWIKTAGARDKFYQTLLLKDHDMHVLVQSKERQSRSAMKKSTKRKSPVRKSTAPTLNSFLMEKKMVTDSIFKKWDPQAEQSRTLPRGVLQGEHFFDNRCHFENGSKPLATYPRSLSNLERRNLCNYSELHQRPSSTSPGRPISAMSQDSVMLGSRPLGSRPVSQTSLVDQEEYKNYILEMVHATQKSPRFQQLQAYYNILDRAMKLEKRSTSMEIHKLRSADVIDYDTWKKLRIKEKATEELDFLLGNLNKAQREREFHYRPKYVETVRWRGDVRLRGRDRSVEHLKSHFTRLVQQEGRNTDEDCNKGQEFKEIKDVYKPLWRARSVTDVAEDINNDNFKVAAASASSLKRGKSCAAADAKASAVCHGRPPTNRLPKGTSATLPAQVRPSSLKAVAYSSFTAPRSKSSLTTAQVNCLKGQLNGIFSSHSSLGSSVRSSRSPSRADNFEVSVSATKLNYLKNQLEGQQLFVKPLPDVVRKSRQYKEKAEKKTANGEQVATDEARRINFFKIGKEIRERNSPVLKRYLSPGGGAQFDLRDSRTPVRFQEVTSGGQKRETSPRTCYSLEAEKPAVDNRQTTSENSDYLLVLNNHRDDKKIDEVKTVVDTWASGDESGSGGGIKRKGSSNKSTESLSSSGASTNTVIHKSVATTGSSSELDQERKKKMKRSIDRMKEIMAREKAKTEAQQRRVSVEELRKSYESLKSMSPIRKKSSDVIKGSDSVQDLRKSYETICVLMPTRSVSFERAASADSHVRQRSSSEEGHSRNVTSSGPQHPSMTNSRSNSNPNIAKRSGSAPKRYRSTSREQLAHDNQKQQSDPSRYSRSYLAMLRSGQVLAKKNEIEGGGKGSSFNLPEVNLEYIFQHLTDLSKPVIKTQEIADIESVRRRLRDRAKQQSEMPVSRPRSPSSKKMKHVSRKMGHSKILGKMIELQSSSQTNLDQGTVTLFEKAKDEDEYLKVYKSGDVESKVSRFENLASASGRRQLRDEKLAGSFTELDTRYPFEPAPTFSWTRRLDGPEVPMPAFNSAQRRLQFANYYGYQPSQIAATMPRPKSSNWYEAKRTVFQQKQNLQHRQEEGGQQPKSLPSDLNESGQQQQQQQQTRRKSGKRD